MFIQALEAENFKKLKKARIEFPGDISVIRGKNEAGKSTTIDALIAVLFYDPSLSATPKYVEEHKSWQSNKLYTLRLFFEAGGENYALEKNFEAKTAILKKKDGDVLSHDIREIQAKLIQWGGYANRDLFESFSVIRKESVALLDAEKRKLAEALQDLVGGSRTDVTVPALMKKIQKALDSIKKGLDRPATKAGKIKAAQERLEELETQMAEEKKRLQDKERLGERISELKTKQEAAKKARDAAKRQHKAVKEYFTARQEADRIEKELDRVLDDIERYQKLEHETGALSEKKKKLKPPKQSDIEEVKDFGKKLNFHTERLEEVSGQINKLEAEQKKKFYPSRVTTIAVSGALAVSGFAGFFYTPLFLLWGVLAGFIIFVLASGQWKRAVTLKELERERLKRQDNVDDLRENLRKILDGYGVATPEDFFGINDTIKDVNERLWAIEEQQKSLLRKHSSFKELQSERRRLEKRLGVEEAKMSEEFRVQPPEPKMQSELEHELEKAEKEAAKFEKELTKESARAESLKVSRESITEKEEKSAQLKEQLDSYERRRKVYEIMVDALSGAQTKSLERTQEVLENTMSDFIGEITASKYNKVRITEEFDVEIYSEEKGDWVSANELSTGAVDQLYIVARFAFINILYRSGEQGERFERRPLVVLDDPFGNFDEERREKMKHILEHMSQEFQIIMVTAVSNYDNWGKVVEI